MIDDIVVRVLGDCGPFSRIGKSIGYQVTIGQFSYLVDCGAPVFQQLGGHKLKEIKGLIVTHCHDDHKRIELVRFTDEGSNGKIVENERDRLVKKERYN